MSGQYAGYDEKRLKLIKIAFELFIAKGYENTSIQDIIRAAKISKGAMYHYFTSKEDILDAVLNYIIDLDVKRLKPMLNDPSLSSMEKITSAMSFQAPQASEEIRRATEYTIQRPASIFDYRARELSRQRSIIGLTNLIYEGVARGEFRTDYPEEMAAFICASSQAMGELIMRPGDENSFQTRIDAFIHMLTKCLGLDGSQQDFLANFFKKHYAFNGMDTR